MNKLTFAAHGIHTRGGMERAAYEILRRMQVAGWKINIIANQNDLPCENTRHVSVASKPAVLRCIQFEKKAHQLLKGVSGLTASIGSAAGPVDVITAQFCHAAFNARVELSRGKGWLGRRWQSVVAKKFERDERRVYGDPRLKRVIAVSQGTADELVEYYNVSRSIIRVVPNGVDTSVFRPASLEEKESLRVKLKLPQRLMLACFVGGDWGRKGLAASIAALAQAQDVALVVVGNGDQTAYLKQAEQLRVADRVFFMGSSRSPQDFMRASDVYVFPSRYEAFSLSCIEAAACGLPLLVTPINGVSELVVDGVNGFFVEEKSENIADKLARLRDDACLRSNMSNTIAAHSLRYDWDTIAEQAMDVYEELL